MIQFFAPAILLGFMGSFHCVGMCGPLAAAVYVNKKSSLNRLQASTLYHIGRIGIYALIGFIFGYFGRGIALYGFQQPLSIIIGIVLIAAALFPTLQLKIEQFTGKTIIPLQRLKQNFSIYLTSAHWLAPFAVGIFNGFLPCGLVYMGVAASLITKSAANSALYMLLFGLGTLPALLLVQFASGKVAPNTWQKLQNLIPWAVGLVGVLLVLRGLNLDIPFLSPFLGRPGAYDPTCG